MQAAGSEYKFIDSLFVEEGLVNLIFGALVGVTIFLIIAKLLRMQGMKFILQIVRRRTANQESGS